MLHAMVRCAAVGSAVGLAASLTPTAHAVIRRVDSASPTAGNGSFTDWSNAYHSLQDALADAQEDDEVWVAGDAQFVWTPHASDPAVSFVLKHKVALQGGYAGYGAADPLVRDFVNTPTILSGDLAGDDSANAPFSASLTDDNSYHVVRAENVGLSAVLDGFTIVAGNAVHHAGSATACGEEEEIPNASGGGLFCRAASPTIRNCVFKGNHALVGGAIGMYCGSAPDIVACVFEKNLAYSGMAEITHIPCGVMPNGLEDSGNGGAIHMRFGNAPRIDNCVFACNLAGHVGGGVSIQHGFNAPDFTNCVFYGNVSGCEGGGVRAGMYSGAVLVNCTFYKNVSNQGGGFSMSPLEEPDCDPPPCTPPRETRLVNCILWGNEVTDVSACGVSWPALGAQISITNDNTDPATHDLDITYCDIQGYSASGEDDVYDPHFHIDEGPRIIDVVPGFADALHAKGQDDRFGTADDGLRLTYASRCMNQGDPDELPFDLADVDADGHTSDQIMPWDVTSSTRQTNPGGCVDLGAYENDVPGTCPGDVAGGANGGPDGTVGAADYALVFGAWGTPGGVADVSGEGQPTCGDGTVDAHDLGFVLGQWGDCASGNRSEGASGPTPATLAESMGFGSVQELAEWLAEPGTEYAQAWLDLMLG
ncbi:MAG: right-handed parallel beta-helix repeat-containing protein [Phycisphaerales bacterium]